MCILFQITWIHPNGAQQPQQYPQFCERSINGQFCSPPTLVDRGQMPIPPVSMQSQSSEDQEEAQGITEEADDGPRRKIVGWVRSSSRRKKKDDPSVQRVLLRGATLEMGNIVEAGGRRRERMWQSKLAMEEIPPRAPSPPYVPVPGYAEQYGQYQQFPQAMPQIQGYGRYPYNNMQPQPQYTPPQYGPGLPGQGYPIPQQQMLRHQAAFVELDRLRHEHRQLDERYRQEERRQRKLEAKLQTAKDEKESVVAENEKLQKKVKRQTKDIEAERHHMQSWSQEMQEYIEGVNTMPDDLTRAKLSYAELKLEESRIRQVLSGLHSRRRRGDRYGRREMAEEQLLEDELSKTHRGLRKLQDYIEDPDDSRFRGARTRSTRKPRESNAAAWADDRRGRRRAQSQDVRRPPPLSSYTYLPAERRRSYSINDRVPPPPPMEPPRRHSRPPPPPPPPAYMRSSVQAFKPRRSSSTNSSVIVALTNSSGIGGSSTSTSRDHKDRDSSRTSSSSSTQSSSVSSGHERKDSKKAYVEDVFDDERGGFSRGRSPYVYLGHDGAREFSQARKQKGSEKKEKEAKKGDKERKEKKAAWSILRVPDTFAKLENLNKLAHSGLSIFDSNTEYFDSTKWEDTPLGHRDQWCQPLVSFVHLLATLPHPAAVFWGEDLILVGNLAWGHASETAEKQGKRASELYEGEGLACLQKCKSGRTVNAANSVFLSRTPEYGRDAPLLLSTVLDDKSERAGIFTQLLTNPQMPSSATGSQEGDGEKEKEDNSTEEDEGDDIDQSEVKRSDDVGTKEDDEQFEKQKEEEGKDPNKPKDEGDEEEEPEWKQGTHANEKPSKRPIVMLDGEKLDLKHNKLFRKFAQMQPTGLALLDKEATALFVNDNFFKLTSNKTHKSFRAWPESIHPEDYERVMKEYREAFSSKEGMRTEFRCEIGDKPEPWRLFLMKPLGDNPEEGGYIVAVVDITDLKAAESSQRHAAEEAKERKEQQERFVDMISHEIRNPLSAILHSSEEIRETVKQFDQDSEIAKELLDATDTILLCVAHQSSLVDEILQFSKLDAAMLTLAPHIAQVKWDLSETLKLFQPELRAKKITFSYAMDYSYNQCKVEYVLADMKRIKQVLVNLMTNAIKFTAKKKGERHISVGIGASTERPDSYPPSVCFFSEGNKSSMDVTLSEEWGTGEPLYLMVAVKDTGIGIDEEGQANLFERFKQATPKTQEKYGGSGLGLFISRKLCQLHGGDVGVSSKQGVGSTFGFFFRVRRAGAPKTNDKDAEEEEPDAISLSETASADVAARSRASSIARSHKGEEFDQPHFDKENMESIEEVKTPADLLNPPTEYIAEAHPGISTDERHNVTAKIADSIQSPEKEKRESESAKLRESDTKLELPLPARPKQSPEKQPKQGSKAVTVLLAEDNIINQKVLSRQLRAKGYDVTPANNGKEAVAAVRTSIEKIQHNNTSTSNGNGTNTTDSHFPLPPTSQPEPTKNGTTTTTTSSVSPAPFDVILMDQEMPYLSGNAATKAIRELEKDGGVKQMPILGVSANVREEQKREMLEAGMNDVIMKPFRVEELVGKIKGLLDDWGN